jgi:hypothetical protein
VAGFFTISTVLCAWHSQSRIFFHKNNTHCSIAPPTSLLCLGQTSCCFEIWQLVGKDVRFSWWRQYKQGLQSSWTILIWNANKYGHVFGVIVLRQKGTVLKWIVKFIWRILCLIALPPQWWLYFI